MINNCINSQPENIIIYHKSTAANFTSSTEVIIKDDKTFGEVFCGAGNNSVGIAQRIVEDKDFYSDEDNDVYFNKQWSGNCIDDPGAEYKKLDVTKREYPEIYNKAQNVFLNDGDYSKYVDVKSIKTVAYYGEGSSQTGASPNVSIHTQYFSKNVNSAPIDRQGLSPCDTKIMNGKGSYFSGSLTATYTGSVIKNGVTTQSFNSFKAS